MLLSRFSLVVLSSISEDLQSLYLVSHGSEDKIRRKKFLWSATSQGEMG